MARGFGRVLLFISRVCMQLGMPIVCGIFLNMRTALTPNMRRKYGIELVGANYPIIPQGSGHVEGAILLATTWSR